MTQPRPQPNAQIAKYSYPSLSHLARFQQSDSTLCVEYLLHVRTTSDDCRARSIEEYAYRPAYCASVPPNAVLRSEMRAIIPFMRSMSREMRASANSFWSSAGILANS